MEKILNIFENLLIDKLMASQSPMNHKSKLRIACLMMSVFVLLMGFVFGTLGFYHFLLENAPEMNASLIVSGSCLFISTILFLIAKYLNKKQIIVQHQHKEEMIETIELIKELVGDDFEKSLQENPKTLLAIAAISGFTFGRKIS